MHSITYMPSCRSNGRWTSRTWLSDDTKLKCLFTCNNYTRNVFTRTQKQNKIQKRQRCNFIILLLWAVHMRRRNLKTEDYIFKCIVTFSLYCTCTVAHVHSRMWDYWTGPTINKKRLLFLNAHVHNNYTLPNWKYINYANITHIQIYRSISKRRHVIMTNYLEENVTHIYSTQKS